MMTPRIASPVTIGKRREIVRMRRVHDETDHAPALFRGSDHAQTRQLRHSLECVIHKIDIVF